MCSAAIISALAGLVALSACATSPDSEAHVDLPLLSDVDLAEDAPAAELLSSEAPETSLFAVLFGPRNTGEPTESDSGTTALQNLVARNLPYGQVVKICGVKGSTLGQEVDRQPARGKAYRLYDSNPASIAFRAYFLSGFKDGCLRQFTAALALIGAPNLHESMRYDEMNAGLAWSDTDKAYERIKRQICGKDKGRPCTGAGARRMEKTTAFVTAYEYFGSNARWTEVLLHNGRLVAVDAQGH